MYLIRLDDASEYWDKEKWNKMHDILHRYGINPIVAIIPHNEDRKLLKYQKDSGFIDTILNWIAEGWTPALHGYNHVLSSLNGGINPVNKRSEFAGVSMDEQVQKIKKGYSILMSMGIITKIFVAPAHTFDENTLLAIRQNCPIRVISDTIANDVYFDKDLWFIPQQSGQVRKMKSKVVTFCYHPNTTTEEQFDRLEKFLMKYASLFGSFDDIELKSRQKSMYDKFLSVIYFARRKLIEIIQN